MALQGAFFVCNESTYLGEVLDAFLVFVGVVELTATLCPVRLKVVLNW